MVSRFLEFDGVNLSYAPRFSMNQKDGLSVFILGTCNLIPKYNLSIQGRSALIVVIIFLNEISR